MASLLMGLLLLSIACYLFIIEIVFVSKATRFDATIVEVRSELVPKGKGSVFAYVPVVEVSDVGHGTMKVKVDTYNEEPVYRIGDQMRLLCDSSLLTCIPNTFLDKWGNSAVDFLLSLVFLSIPVLYHRNFKRNQRLRETP